VGSSRIFSLEITKLPWMKLPSVLNAISDTKAVTIKWQKGLSRLNKQQVYRRGIETGVQGKAVIEKMLFQSDLNTNAEKPTP
jgi:hypothetical protein